MLINLKDELPEIISCKGDTNEVIKQYKELIEKKIDFYSSKNDFVNLQKNIDNLEKMSKIENLIEKKNMNYNR